MRPEKTKRKTLKSGVIEHEVHAPVEKIRLTNAKFKCTSCGKWKGAEKFGLRSTYNGGMLSGRLVIRNQSQCKDCRVSYRND